MPRKPSPLVCSQCGARRRLEVRYAPSGERVEDVRRRCHEDAPDVIMSRGLRYAINYLTRVAQMGRFRLDAWVEVADIEREYKGVTREQLREALELLRRWRPPDFREGAVPAAPGPITLYGRTPR